MRSSHFPVEGESGIVSSISDLPASASKRVRDVEVFLDASRNAWGVRRSVRATIAEEVPPTRAGYATGLTENESSFSPAEQSPAHAHAHTHHTHHKPPLEQVRLGS